MIFLFLVIVFFIILIGIGGNSRRNVAATKRVESATKRLATAQNMSNLIALSNAPLELQWRELERQRKENTIRILYWPKSFEQWKKEQGLTESEPRTNDTQALQRSVEQKSEPVALPGTRAACKLPDKPLFSD